MVRAAGNSAYSCGTKITIPCLSPREQHKGGVLQILCRSGFFTSVRLIPSFGPRENCESSSRSHSSVRRRPT